MTIIHKLSIAPMVDWSYSHFRVFMHMLAPNALHYTDMQTTGAVLNNTEKALLIHEQEHSTALQLGGSNPKDLSVACELSHDRGFKEINLNLGCPSDRVQAGMFGACMMAKPKLVQSCIKAMKESTALPVTAKTRIGIDDCDDYEFFRDFCMAIVDAGADKLIIHARKAWLNGLSPHENRTIPPINYDFVYKLKQELHWFPIIINGNINSYHEIMEHLKLVDGVMLGRLACQNPWAIYDIHQKLYPINKPYSRFDVVKGYLDYCLVQYTLGHPLSVLLKPIYNISHGQAGASSFRKKLNDIVQSKSSDNLYDCLQFLPDALVKDCVFR